jgi:hypothetical protein
MRGPACNTKDTVSIVVQKLKRHGMLVMFEVTDSGERGHTATKRDGKSGGSEIEVT